MKLSHDMSFLTSWDEAARFPVRTIVVIFAIMWVATAFMAYFFVVDGELLWSTVIGFLAATLFAIFIRAQLKGDQRPSSSHGTRGLRYAFDAFLIVVGVTILMVGLLAGRSDVAVTGLPLALLGGILLVLRRKVPTR
jgi:hypothetical protein